MYTLYRIHIYIHDCLVGFHALAQFTHSSTNFHVQFLCCLGITYRAVQSCLHIPRSGLAQLEGGQVHCVNIVNSEVRRDNRYWRSIGTCHTKYDELMNNHSPFGSIILYMWMCTLTERAPLINVTNMVISPFGRSTLWLYVFGIRGEERDKMHMFHVYKWCVRWWHCIYVVSRMHSWKHPWANKWRIGWLHDEKAT